ncbi:MAG: YqaA family protein [Terriglobales bacterium]
MSFVHVLAFSLVDWLHRLGAVGLFLVGIIDNSFIPIPGGVDIFTVLLVSSHRSEWFYYAALATVSSVFGGWLTYRLARKGGEETLEKKIGKQRAEKVYEKFEKHGFSTIVVGAILPPPFPIVPVLMAPGILEYPTRKFIFALTVGRGLRYTAIAYLAHVYGEQIIGFLTQYQQPLLYTLLALAGLGGIAALIYFKYYRPKRRREEKQAGEPMEELPIPGMGNRKLKEQQQGTARQGGGGDAEIAKEEEEKRSA